MKKTETRVKLLKEEFAKFSGKNNKIETDGFEALGKELEIDIYSDVRRYFLTFLDFYYLFLLSLQKSNFWSHNFRGVFKRSGVF